MAKRKQLVHAADRPDGVVFTSSKLGRFDLLKDFFYANPIWSGARLQKCGKCYDLVSSLPVFPRGQRSKGRVRTGKTVTLLNDSPVGNVVSESRNQCHTDKYSPQKTRSKQQAKFSYHNFLCEHKSYCLRQSTKQQRMAMSIQKWGKLDSGKFEVYLENIWRSYPEEKRNVFTYLSPLWFSLYLEGAYKEKVLSWIKTKNIFSKKYVFIPIVQWGHWFLLILCNFGESRKVKAKSRCMLLLDSLKEANAKQLEPGIRRFVFDLFSAEERLENKNTINKIPLRIPQVPRQRSDSECGFYVLYYIKSCAELLEDCSFSMGYPHFMKENWFGPEEVECFVLKLESIWQKL